MGVSGQGCVPPWCVTEGEFRPYLISYLDATGERGGVGGEKTKGAISPRSLQARSDAERLLYDAAH